jgi:hypothetical protein
MKIIKCDLCNKRVKNEPVTAGIGFFPKAELCEKCGSPILKFLKKHKFLESKKIKK